MATLQFLASDRTVVVISEQAIPEDCLTNRCVVTHSTAVTGGFPLLAVYLAKFERVQLWTRLPLS